MRRLCLAALAGLWRVERSAPASGAGRANEPGAMDLRHAVIGAVASLASRGRGELRYAVPTFVLVVSTGFGILAKPWLGEGYASLIFVVGIMLIGAWSGLRAAVGCAVAGAMAFNYFVADPVWQINFDRHTDFAPPAVFVACAVISGLLSGRLRDETIRAEDTNDRLESLLETSRALQGASDPALVQAVLAQQVTGRLAMPLALFDLADGVPQPVNSPAPDPGWTAAAVAVCAAPADLLRVGPLTAFRLQGGHGPVGALVVAGAGNTGADRSFMAALARLVGLALERAHLAGEVAETRAQARTEELKTALLSSISHDLRTPLTTIRTAASSLLTFGDAIDAATAAELLGGIVAECDRLNHLTANLLQMTRLQAGEGAMHASVLPAGEMIRSLIARQAPLAGARRITFAAPPAELLIEAEPALFELALVNVLQNAVKYSADDSRIVVTCAADAGACVIAVSDEGIGVAPGEQARVFDRFYRGSRGASGPKGSGLGLAIAKGFVEAAQGTIVLASPVKAGRGTTITIRLPLAPQDPGP